ncbi:V-set domain-containing T-cell activation inhibitor 1-like isoform X4 [Sander lucioperca]|uniref:V-set domain-containing T-cell activation inhibitor 1-like isoform X4 n=1 Tax=Sander lucioperca TaxID=283035 RepID=UPI0016534D28|nr:V-set domain-containing T-cell activation inhibitor 1-like isoform X4 [Sander lucioperca]
MKTFTSLLDVMMKILLITFLLFPETILGEHHLTCPQTIEAAEGEDVNIQCGLDPPVNLSDYTLDVARERDDHGNYDDVYSYRRGKDHLDDQMGRYRGRTTLNHEDLIRGNVTLKISSVNLSDSGNYIVFLKKLQAPSVINITVVSKDQANRTKRNDSSTSGPPVEEETESDHRGDGENRKTARAVILPSVLLLWILLVLVLLLMRGRKEKNPETAANRYEEKNLNMEAAKADEDLERAAGNLI